MHAQWTPIKRKPMTSERKLDIEFDCTHIPPPLATTPAIDRPTCGPPHSRIHIYPGDVRVRVQSPHFNVDMDVAADRETSHTGCEGERE